MGLKPVTTSATKNIILSSPGRHSNNNNIICAITEQYFNIKYVILPIHTAQTSPFLFSSVLFTFSLTSSSLQHLVSACFKLLLHDYIRCLSFQDFVSNLRLANCSLSNLLAHSVIYKFSRWNSIS